jgi:hypothetical protein
MGNFTLMARANKAHQQVVVNYYRQKIGKTPVVLSAGEYDLIYCDKGFIPESHLLIEGNKFACFSGTPILRGTRTIGETVRGLFNRLADGKFDPAEVRGSYAFVFYEPGKPIQLGHDPVKVAGLYSNKNQSVISSSFACTVLGTEQALTLNINAVTELCLLGHITGKDSIYNDISKINCSSTLKIPGVEWLTVPQQRRSPLSTGNFKQEVAHQLNVIDSLFTDIAGFCNHYGVNLGISDGHDSRLLAGFFNKKLKKYSFYSFWRKEENLEIIISKAIAETSGKELKMIEGKDVYDKTEEEVIRNFEESFYLCDGQARLHCYFFDDFNTGSFLRKLANQHLMSANGVGGEQYRNDQHLQFNYSKPLDFFYHNLIDQGTPGVIQDPAAKKSIAQYMIGKFSQELKEAGLTGKQDVYDRYQLHFFFNEYHNNAFRLNRTNGENQFMMQFAPYLDSQLVFNSYSAIKHHGISFSFQQEMIRQTSPELAEITSVYGYSFSKGEPLMHKIKYLVKHFTPNSILVKQRMKLYSDQSGHKMLSQYPALKRYKQVIENLDLSIDLEKLFLHPDRWPIILSLGFSISFFEEMKKMQLTKSNER